MRLTTFLICTLIWINCTAQTTYEFSQGTQSEQLKHSKQTTLPWGLTEEEWSKLEFLKSANSGLISLEITPLEWLGIFSENDSERERYATLLAERQLAVLKAVQEFETAYLSAIKNLARRNSTLSYQDRIVLVTSIACETVECQLNLKESIKHATAGGITQILIRESLSRSLVHQWAITQKIPIDLLRSGNISIGHSYGQKSSFPNGITRLK